MKTDRRAFLHVAGSALVIGSGIIWSAAAQASSSTVSFPGIPNPLEGSVEVIANNYQWTEGPASVGGHPPCVGDT